MKRILNVLLVVYILFAAGCKQKTHDESSEGELSGTITISGAWALYPIAVKWAEEFQKVHPKVKIDVSAGGAGKGVTDALTGVVDIGNVSRDVYPEEIEKGAWWVAVTKDAVVPTINEKNPVMKELLLGGIKKETFVGIWISGEVKKWGEVAGKEISGEIHVYTRSDACGAAEIWAKFVGGKQEDLIGVGVYGDPGLAEAVREDILGIGYNNINYAYDAKTGKPIAGIRIVPIDLNGNGKVDADENFFNSEDKIVSAITTGKYPSPPARELNFVCRGKPRRKVVVEFIKWVLTNGQKFVPETGYIKLTEEKLQEELKKLE